jgi:signal transduction histidine kinase
LLLATYTVAAYKKPGWAIAAVALALFSWSPYPAKYRCLCLLDIGTLAIFAAAAGVAMQGGRRLNRELEKLLDLLLRTREERARLAVAEERTRVAREMHDVVAHGLTVMVVQAGGARMVVESDPTLSQEMLGDVERMGLEAIRELESLVGTLDPGSHPREEEVSIEAPDVPALVARLRRSGQTIHLTEEGASVPLDQGLQISLYRIVQEALTNARKHAPGTRAIVAIRYLSQAVEVEITNGAAAGAATAGVPGAGQGLIGIRERASLLGGTAEAGPIQGGGFRVSASLPLELVPA